MSDGLDESRSEAATVLAMTWGVLSAGSGSESPRISQAIAETARTPARVVYAIGLFFNKLLLRLESVAQSTRTIPKDWSDLLTGPQARALTAGAASPQRFLTVADLSAAGQPAGGQGWRGRPG
ncbi:MAG TPA: hypothetical protein VJ883_12180, partial [Woeseiaceae bacterium]|nr:hypothetical protein [Woeseiaceae bacterium]